MRGDHRAQSAKDSPADDQRRSSHTARPIQSAKLPDASFDGKKFTVNIRRLPVRQVTRQREDKTPELLYMQPETSPSHKMWHLTVVVKPAITMPDQHQSRHYTASQIQSIPFK